MKRCLDSIEMQTFKDYEIIQSEDEYGLGMSRNTNHVMSKASGELIKILYQDDYFATRDSLQQIVDGFEEKDMWLVTACGHDPGASIHHPYYSEDKNTIGSPSVVTIRRTVTERFDPNLKWVLDLDFYRRLHKKYGEPKILNSINVVIGVGDHQETSRLSDEIKRKEELL